MHILLSRTRQGTMLLLKLLETKLAISSIRLKKMKSALIMKLLECHKFLAKIVHEILILVLKSVNSENCTLDAYIPHLNLLLCSCLPNVMILQSLGR